MSYILNMFICVYIIFLDNLLQCLLFINMIDLFRTCDNTDSLICYTLVMLMIYLWIKIKLKLLLFSTESMIITTDRSLSTCTSISLLITFIPTYLDEAVVEEEAEDGCAHSLLLGDGGLHHRIDGIVHSRARRGVEARGQLRRRHAAGKRQEKDESDGGAAPPGT
jgi:hypothetical protein